MDDDKMNDMIDRIGVRIQHDIEEYVKDTEK